jgi:hypothetical protein
VVKGLRLDEVDSESPGKVRGEEETEGGAFRVRAAIIAVKSEREQGKEEDFVKLGRMTRDAVAEVYSPRKGRGCAVRIVGKTGEKASDTADADADAEGNGEEVTGARMNVLETLGDFDCDPAAKKSADDGLAARKEEVSPSELREGDFFEETE